MTNDELKATAKDAFGPMIAALGLRHVDIELGFSRLPEGDAGRVVMRDEYNTASITLDLGDEHHQGDAERVLDTLRHELLHVLLMGDTPLVAAARELVDGRQAHQLVEQTIRQCQERQISGLERTLETLGLTPERLVEHGKALLADPTAVPLPPSPLRGVGEEGRGEGPDQEAAR